MLLEISHRIKPSWHNSFTICDTLVLFAVNPLLWSKLTILCCGIPAIVALYTASRNLLFFGFANIHLPIRV